MTTVLTVELFSRYRTELMGIAVIGVLIAHLIGLGEIGSSHLLIKIIGFIPRLAFTEGFLFLSGFGLYYSFAGNGNVKEFYLRRAKRLLIPFIILSVWFFLYKDLIEMFNPLNFFLHCSSLAFWFDGNYYGMWYISISVFLYTIFPLFYKYISKPVGGIMTAIFVLITVILNIALQQFLPEYYDKIAIGINKIPVFIIGVYAGKLSLYNNHTGSSFLLCLVGMFWIISYFLKNRLGYAMAIYTVSEKIVYMFAICTLFSVSEDMILTKWIRKILKWLGHYSLELYVLHLLIFSFLYSETLFGDIASIAKASIMVIGALLLCVPFHRLTNVFVEKAIRQSPKA